MKISEVMNYKVEELIGQGSFGKVYRGCNRITQQQVALKIIECKYLLLHSEARRRRTS